MSIVQVWIMEGIFKQMLMGSILGTQPVTILFQSAVCCWMKYILSSDIMNLYLARITGPRVKINWGETSRGKKLETGSKPFSCLLEDPCTAVLLIKGWSSSSRRDLGIWGMQTAQVWVAFSALNPFWEKKTITSTFGEEKMRKTIFTIWFPMGYYPGPKLPAHISENPWACWHILFCIIGCLKGWMWGKCECEDICSRTNMGTMSLCMDCWH